MGLFDKLRDVADVAKDSLDKAAAVANQAIESAQSAADPFSDPEIKQYFQVACGMNGFYKWAEKRPLDSERDPLFPKFKKYAEHILGKACDDAKLKKAWELFFSAWHYASYGQAAKNHKFREDTEESGIYQQNPYETCRLCYPEEIAEFAVKYERILDIIKDDVSYDNFNTGLQRLFSKDSLGKSDLLDVCIAQVVVANSFCAENPVTQEIVLGIIRNNIGAIHNAERFIDTASLLTLKALHFENYSGNKENYTTITDEDLRDFVLTETYYKEQIDKQLFDKDEYIDTLAARIRNTKILHEDETYHRNAFSPDYVDHYYCDMICNLLWKESANSRDWTMNGEQVKHSTDPVIAMKIVANYFAENR